jgi:hypothetical protein
MDDLELLQPPKTLKEKTVYWFWYALGFIGTVALFWHFIRVQS